MRDNDAKNGIQGLDPQEEKIARALVRNPRLSDNRLGEENDLAVRSVSRKRARLEKEGVLRYYAEVDLSESGTGQYPVSYLFVIKFRLGVDVAGLRATLIDEPRVVTTFTQSVQYSFAAECDGRVALVMVVSGKSSEDVLARLHGEILPTLDGKHGPDAVEDLSALQLIVPLRILRNYLPDVNMVDGRMREDWGLDAIFVG